MNVEKCFNSIVNNWLKATVVTAALALSACGSSDDDESLGNLRFYNLSEHSPAIYLTLDEDLNDEDDDAFERTYTGVSFGSVGSTVSLDTESYFYEIAYQDDDSTTRDELEILLEGSLSVEEDATQLLVLNDDISSPELLIYNIPAISEDEDEDDEDNDLFNIQVLNMFASDDNVTVYYSKDDETFNEAALLGDFSYKELSDNQKLDQDSYIFYIVDADTNEVVFESTDITFSFSTQFILSIRENTSEGNSPYVIDFLSTSSVTEYIDVNTQSKFTAYNAITTHDLLPDYQGNVVLDIESIDHSATTETFSYGTFSTELTQENGDYSIMLTAPETDTVIIENHLLTLSENSDKAIFFYLLEENVDDDNDGDFDENNDGIIDEIEVSIQSLIVDKSTNTSIYDHEIRTINFIDSDDFSFVELYYVRNGEVIDTADYHQSVSFGESSVITLLNNTYTVYVVAEDNSSELILTTFEVVLGEESTSQYIILENDDLSASGYRATVVEQ